MTHKLGYPGSPSRRPGTVSHHFTVVASGDMDVTPDQLNLLHSKRPAIEAAVAREASRIVRETVAGRTVPAVTLEYRLPEKITLDQGMALTLAMEKIKRDLQSRLQEKVDLVLGPVGEEQKAEAERLTAKEPKVEPGLPLRQFVRGFLRDHLGFSKIMAHHAADLFMKRWNERDEKRAKRYAREDQHTTAATLARAAAEHADANTERL